MRCLFCRSRPAISSFSNIDLMLQVGDGTGVMGLFQLRAAGRIGVVTSAAESPICSSVSAYSLTSACAGGIGDLLGLALGLVLEADQSADQDGHHHGDQHAGLGQRLDLLQPQHQDQGEDRHGQRGQMGLRQIAEHLPDVLEEGIAAPLGDAQQHVELRQGDDDRRRIHEAQNHRVRDEIDDGAQLEDARGRTG